MKASRIHVGMYSKKFFLMQHGVKVPKIGPQERKIVFDYFYNSKEVVSMPEKQRKAEALKKAKEFLTNHLKTLINSEVTKLVPPHIG